MPEEKETCMNSYDLPISLQDKLKRVDEIHRAIHGRWGESNI